MLKRYLHIIFLLVSVNVYAGYQNIPEDIKIIHLKPRNAPDSVTHTNKMDEKGQKWGIWQYYSNSGALMLEISYEKNKRTGVYRRYRGTSGKKLEEGHFEKGKKEGKYTRYFSNGMVRVKGFYQGGLKIGTWTFYYKDNGGLRIRGTYLNGYKEGTWRYYDKAETVKRTVEYKEGKIVSNSK